MKVHETSRCKTVTAEAAVGGDPQLFVNMATFIFWGSLNKVTELFHPWKMHLRDVKGRA